MQKGILYLIDRLAIGGTEGQLCALLQGLDPERFQPHLGTLYHSNTDRVFLDVPRLPLSFKAFCHPSTFRCIWQLSSYIRRHRIRIVQAFFQDPTGIAALSRPFHSARLVGSFRDLGFWRNPKESFKMRLAYPAFNGFIANSKAVKENFTIIDGIPSSKIEVICNGITLDEKLVAESLLATKQQSVVGIVANLNRPVKRVQDFVRAAVLVRKQCLDARFIVVGDGELRPSLEALSHSLGLGDVLRFEGQIKQPLEFVRSFSVGVNTSETEGFSNAILEYMACGIPVVATANGGNSELVSEGVHGFLVPVGNVELMAEKIVTLLQEEELRRRIRSSNLQLIRSCFSLEQMVRAHETYYDQLLAKLS